MCIRDRVTAQTMKVHPALAFGAVIAGTALLGAVGALLALPVAATLQAFFSSFMARYNVEVDVTAGALPDTETHDEHATGGVTHDGAPEEPEELVSGGDAEIIEPDA